MQPEDPPTGTDDDRPGPDDDDHGGDRDLPPSDDPGPADGTRASDGARAADDLDGYETSMARFARRFRLWLGLLVALALVLPAGNWLVDELLFRRSADRVEDSVDPAVVDAVLLVRAIGCDGQVSTGSAFVTAIDGELRIVSNRHVVAGARTVSVRALEGGTSTAVASYALAPQADVAVLRPAPGMSLPAPLPLGPSAEEGQDVRLVGFPAALPFTTAGTVVEGSPHRLILDLRTDPGASGSPVIDAEERVVGQIFARTSDGRGVATPVALLAKAIASAEPASGC